MKPKASLSLIAVLCTLGALQQTARAEQNDQSERYSLGEIVVSAPGEGVQASEAVCTVSAEEIRSKGARTLDQAIALVPGVNVRTGGEGVPRIDIRGFKTRHVLLLLDGVPMNSAIDQQFDPTSIPTENIEEIKLTSGPSSVLYGQGGLGGVINIITKKGSQGVHGSVGMEVGDREPYLARATVSGASERVNFFLSGSATQVDAFPLSNDFKATSEQGNGYRRNSDRERSSLLGTIGFTPNQDLALGLTVNYSRGAFGKPASTISLIGPGDPFASVPKYQRVTEYADVSVQLAAEYAFTRQLSLKGWTYFNHHQDHENQYDNGNLDSFSADGSFRERVETDVKGITLQPKYDFGSAGTLTFSLAAEGDSWDNSGVLSQVSASDGSLSFGSLEAHKSLAIYSAGAEYTVAPLAGLQLVAGYGHYWQTRDEMDQDDYSLLLGANYDLTATSRVKASFKRNVRFPSLGDLYDLDKGNPSLAAEVARTYQVGVEQKLPRNSRVELTGFYTTASNLIQNDQQSSQNQNLADVRFAGAELALSFHPVQNLTLQASYTYLHSEDNSRAGRDQLQYTPGNQVNLEAKYDFPCGFSPYLALHYVGNQYFYTKNSETVVQRAKLEDFVVVNLKLNQRLWEGRSNLYLGVNNLFDQNFETSYGFPQPGRFIYGGVEFRI